MSLIRIRNLSFSYPDSAEPVFENVSLQIDTDWKLGFIGRNGRGKTTFLNLLQKKYEYAGSIQMQVEFAYFPFPVGHPDWLTESVLEEIAPSSEPWERMRELNLLELPEDILWRPFETLSHGEQTKVKLAALFLLDGRFLLIDEPTNHLDLEGRRKVSEYLNQKKGFILISHDRSFLDGCVDHILSLNRTDIELQSGNYSSWFLNFERKQGYEQAEQERLRKEMKRMEAAAARTSQWSGKTEAGKYGAQNSGSKVDRGFVGHKSAKLMKRAKTLEKRQQKAIEETKGLLANQETADALKLFPLSYHSQTLMTLNEVSAIYDGQTVLEPVTFTIERGDRIALDGRNGSGKSSLLKLIRGEKLEHTGEIDRGGGLVLSCVDQSTDMLKGSLTDYADQSGVELTLFLAMLRKLGFEREQFETPMERLSGGQRKKVVLARSLCQQAHLYLWDEPLNDLDIDARLQIEAVLEEYSPTMVFVEHDAAFRERICTRSVEIFRMS